MRRVLTLAVAFGLGVAAAGAAFAGLLGGVGQLMMPGQLQADPVFPTFYITTGSGSPITTGSGSRLVTGNAP